MLAYEGCARAMYQSWAVLGLGLAVFALSSFVPTQRFGAMMFLLLTAALIGNLFYAAAGAGQSAGVLLRPATDEAGQDSDIWATTSRCGASDASRPKRPSSHPQCVMTTRTASRSGS